MGLETVRWTVAGRSMEITFVNINSTYYKILKLKTTHVKNLMNNGNFVVRFGYLWLSFKINENFTGDISKIIVFMMFFIRLLHVHSSLIPLHCCL